MAQPRHPGKQTIKADDSAFWGLEAPKRLSASQWTRSPEDHPGRMPRSLGSRQTWEIAGCRSSKAIRGFTIIMDSNIDPQILASPYNEDTSKAQP